MVNVTVVPYRLCQTTMAAYSLTASLSLTQNRHCDDSENQVNRKESVPPDSLGACENRGSTPAAEMTALPTNQLGTYGELNKQLTVRNCRLKGAFTADLRNGNDTADVRNDSFGPPVSNVDAGENEYETDDTDTLFSAATSRLRTSGS